MRRLVAGTGWKMNIGVAEAVSYAKDIQKQIGQIDVSEIDIFVLPPFTSLHATADAFGKTPFLTSGQNMHWEYFGNWTGEVSAQMLVEAGCHYVELAHSERLQHFGETYQIVRRKIDSALSSGLIPIICLGETSLEKAEGRADEILAEQLLISLCGQPDERVPDVILAYEPRWVIGGAEPASSMYVADRHKALRDILKNHRGQAAADRTCIIYGGSVILGGGGTTHEAFQVVTDAKKHGAHVALFGRKITAAKHQRSFVKLRYVTEGAMSATTAVIAYRSDLKNHGLVP